MIQLLMTLLGQLGLLSLDKQKIFGFLWRYEFSAWHLLLLVAVLSVPAYVYSKWHVGYFKRRGIKHCDNIYPVVGHMLSAMTAREHFLDVVARTYSAFPDEKYVGHMQLNRPLIMLRDLELIKRAGIKDFDHFVDHYVTVNEDQDSIFGNHLFALKGDKWRDMRATLSPAFTSSKMRGMFDFVSETGEQMAAHFLKRMQEEPECKERGLVEVEMKDAFTRYTNDVIATSAFGIKVNSLDDQDNDFYNQGKASTNFGGRVFFKFFLFSSFPRLMKLTRLSLIDESIKDFFRGLVLNTMKDREEKGITRPDMIQLLSEAQKGSLKHEAQNHHEKEEAGFATVEESHVGQRTVKRQWTDDDIVAQALLFFIAGFDTASTLLCFMAHELAMNQEVQKKLQEEVDEMIAENGEHLDYSLLGKLPYMDMVVSETLRLWPPAVATDRKCIKPFKLPPSSENEGYTVVPGEGIWIPIYGIHRDEKYYPNPNKFDPERFSEENKANIDPMAFLPFGVGPRNCIGSRFALMEIKAVMFHLLANFNFVPTAKTQHPIKLNNSTFNMHAENGFWLGLEPRNKL